MVKFNFLGNKIELSLGYLGVAILALIISTFLYFGLLSSINQLTHFLVFVVQIYIPVAGYLSRYMELIRAMVHLSTTLMFAAILFVIAGKLIKNLDKEKIKSLCANYLIISIPVIIIYFMGSALELSYELAVLNTLNILLSFVFSSAIIFIWLTIFKEWNTGKIMNCVKNAVILGIIISLIINGINCIYRFGMSEAIFALDYPEDIAYQLLYPVMALGFLLTPVIYYMKNKKRIGKVDYFFAGIIILSAATIYLLYGLSELYMPAGLISVYLWWIYQKKKNQ